MLLVGNPGLALKGFDCAIATLGLVNRSRLVEVHWVCQQEPSSQLQALADTCSLRISLHINPPQVHTLPLCLPARPELPHASAMLCHVWE